MDLISSYLLIIIIIFSANIALLLGNYKLNNLRLLAHSLSISVVSFIVIFLASFLKKELFFLQGYFSILFIIIAFLAFLIFIYYFKDSKKRLKITIKLVMAVFLASIFSLSSQAGLNSLFYCVLYALLILVILFLVYQISKLLVHAKRPYPVIIGEYTCLYAILIFIFGLTYYSTFTLDYSMFSPFLILTPTYQLIYIIIAFIFVIIVGLLYNDFRRK